MDYYKNINFNFLKLGKPYINFDNNLEIPIIYNNKIFEIEIPENCNEYFKLENYNDNNHFFNSLIKLDITSMDDRSFDEYIIEDKDIYIQDVVFKFRNFILDLKNRLMKLFFNEIKINDNYLNEINLKQLDLEFFEINKAIWNENLDFSLIPESINTFHENSDEEESEDEEENNSSKEHTKGLENMVFRYIFYVNNFTSNKKIRKLKCSIIFINEKLEDKKHIYINWMVI